MTTHDLLHSSSNITTDNVNEHRTKKTSTHTLENFQFNYDSELIIRWWQANNVRQEHTN